MPLKKGHGREVVSQNINEMVRSGYKPKQAIAAALASSRKSKKMMMADGGGVWDQAKDWASRELTTKLPSESMPEEKVNRDPSAHGAKSVSDYFNKSYADGGEVKDPDYSKPQDPVKPLESSDPLEKGGQSLGKMLGAGAKFAVMARGGMVMEGDDEGENHHEGMFELMKLGDQGEISNPQSMSEHQKLAKALMKHEEDSSYYASGGLVEGMDGDEKPSDIVASDSEPMSSEPYKPNDIEHKLIEGVPMVVPSGLSEEAKKAIAANKMKRRYSR